MNQSEQRRAKGRSASPRLQDTDDLWRAASEEAEEAAKRAHTRPFLLAAKLQRELTAEIEEAQLFQRTILAELSRAPAAAPGCWRCRLSRPTHFSLQQFRDEAGQQRVTVPCEQLERAVLL